MSSNNFTSSIKLAQLYLYKIGGPILIVLGNISCIINLIIFTRKNLRKSPCSIYFIAFNISNFILINFLILLTTLLSGYNVNQNVFNLTLCRSNFYMTLTLDIISACYLILASIDRMLITSRNVRTRQRSTNRLAYISIIIVTLFWILFHSHTLILVNGIPTGPNQYRCFFNLGLYYTLITYYTLIIKGICVPLLLITFGLWTLKNIRSIMHQTRVAPIGEPSRTMTGAALSSTRSKDRQLSLMLLIEISIYVIFTSVLTSVLMYGQLTQNNVKSADELQFSLLLSTIGNFSNFIPYCIGGYINILVSKIFRKEVKDILFCK